MRLIEVTKKRPSGSCGLIKTSGHHGSMFALSVGCHLSVIWYLLLVACCIRSGGFGFQLHSTATSKSAIHMSLGDPDLGTKWRQLRETVQPLARSVDAAIWNDPDLPGLTFPTPIIWAPWYVPILYSLQHYNLAR